MNHQGMLWNVHCVVTVVLEKQLNSLLCVKYIILALLERWIQGNIMYAKKGIKSAT